MSWPPASLAARSVSARTTNGSDAKEGYCSRDDYKNLIDLPPSANRIRGFGVFERQGHMSRAGIQDSCDRSRADALRLLESVRAIHQNKPGANCALSILFMRLGVAEIGENAVTQVFCDEAAETERLSPRRICGRPRSQNACPRDRAWSREL
jgi:hypothetical protein